MLIGIVLLVAGIAVTIAALHPTPFERWLRPGFERQWRWRTPPLFARPDVEAFVRRQRAFSVGIGMLLVVLGVASIAAVLS